MTMRQIRQNERNIGLYIVLLYQMNKANYIKLQMNYFIVQTTRWT